MLTNKNTHPVAITRRDGVATTVWRKNDEVSTTRLRGVATIPVPQNTLPADHPITLAMEFDATDIIPQVKPHWWTNFVTASETGGGNDIFASSPELLDVVPSPIGDLAVVWQPISQAKRRACTLLLDAHHKMT